MISYERLHDALHYNPETGVFTRKIGSGTSKVGDIAGYNLRGYIRISIDNRQHEAHRLAWLYIYGYWPENEIDHIDRNPSNNSISNLREVSRQCNMRNTGMLKNNTSGIKGVHFDKNRCRWLAHIKINQKNVYLGRFENKIDAAISRYNMELKTNFHKCATDSSAYNYIKKNAPEVA